MIHLQAPSGKLEAAEDLMHMDSPASNFKQQATQASLASGSEDSDIQLKEGQHIIGKVRCSQLLLVVQLSWSTGLPCSKRPSINAFLL